MPIVVTIVLVFVAMFLVFQFLLSLILFIYPVAIAVSLFVAKNGGAQHAPDVTVAPGDFDDRGWTVKILERSREYNHARRSHAALTDRGMSAGLSFTKASGNQRFDNRNRSGRELNQALDENEAVQTDLYNSISMGMAGAIRDLPDYRPIISKWVKMTALRESTHYSLIAFLVGFISLIAWELMHPGKFLLKDDFLLYSPLPRIFEGPTFYAAILSAVSMGPIYLFRFNKIIQYPILNAAGWTILYAKWGGSYDSAYFRAGSTSSDTNGSKSDHGRDDASARSPPTEADDGEPWFEVLGVPEDAPVDQIKAAYRSAIKSYHPDSVASSGQKLRDIAEAESKHINAAYTEARKKRSF